jgi:hypothetical protein
MEKQTVSNGMIWCIAMIGVWSISGFLQDGNLYLLSAGIANIVFAIIRWKLSKLEKWLPLILFLPAMIGYYTGEGLGLLLTGLILPLYLIGKTYYEGDA